MKYVAYYRVSTKEQGDSGLGLDAQMSMVRQYTSKNGEIMAEFTEIESGKRNNRPKLAEALEVCKKEDCTLVIAKLDRLSRNLTFISMLTDAGTRFVCADMPEATEVTIHIFAVIAQAERKMIADRTKKALVELKKQGKKLGKPENLAKNLEKAVSASIATRQAKAQANPNTKLARAHAEALMELGKDWTQIKDSLNSKGFVTATGKSFSVVQAQRLIPWRDRIKAA